MINRTEIPTTLDAMREELRELGLDDKTSHDVMTRLAAFVLRWLVDGTEEPDGMDAIFAHDDSDTWGRIFARQWLETASAFIEVGDDA